MDIMGILDTAVAFSIGAVTVRWYGIIIAAAMALGIYLAFRETRRRNMDTDDLLNMVLIAVPAAIIGARLYYVIFQWDELYAAHPEEIFAIWNGGLAIHGGVIAGVLAIFIFCRVKKYDFFSWTDVLAPSLILGQAIGRWGNFANGEAFGPVIEEGSFWSWVPLQVYNDGAWHHPTFLYESIWNLAIFIFLMLLIRRPYRIGAATAWYFILYSAGRFFIEALRTDSLMLGGLKAAQIVSIIGIVAGIIILICIRKRPKIDATTLPPREKKSKKVKDKKDKNKKDSAKR